MIYTVTYRRRSHSARTVTPARPGPAAWRGGSFGRTGRVVWRAGLAALALLVGAALLGGPAAPARQRGECAGDLASPAGAGFAKAGAPAAIRSLDDPSGDLA